MDHHKTFSNIIMKSYAINIEKNSDNVIFLENGNIFRVENILQNESAEIFFYGYTLLNPKDVGTYPEASSKVGVYQVIDDIGAQSMKEVIPINKFSCKCVAIPTTSSELIAMRMFH